MSAPRQDAPEGASFCAVPLPHVVYAGPRTRAEFDLIALPETVHAWQFDSLTTLVKDDGQRWECRCHSKALGDHSANSVTVIFQWFDHRPAEDAPQGGAA